MELSYNDLVAFHGHSCPGLTIGYRMSKAALASMEGKRAEDEEIVAIVENDACGVDALQCLSGCTFGKGNLIFNDFGKHVYTLYNRKTRKGVRVSFKASAVPDGLKEDRKDFMKWLLDAPDNAIVDVTEVQIEEPEPARIFKSVTCALCGEEVMETRTRKMDDKIACIPCAKK
jgi:formylmethanofuran dehydrogenase subunit E